MSFNRDKIAWRGYVTHDLKVIAWPTLALDHREFNRVFFTKDEDFAARWRQWEPRGTIDFEPGASQEAMKAARDWVDANSD